MDALRLELAIRLLLLTAVITQHVRHNRALQQDVLAITTVTGSVPWVADEMRRTFGAPSKTRELKRQAAGEKLLA